MTEPGSRLSRNGNTHLFLPHLYVFKTYVGYIFHLSLACSRLLCYKCITDTMQELVNQSKAAPQSPSVPKQPGPPVMTSDPNMLSNEEAAAHVSMKDRSLFSYKSSI